MVGHTYAAERLELCLFSRPTNKEATEVPEGDYVNPVFQNNPGKTSELVNLKEHPYVKGVCPYFDTCKRRNYGSQLKLDLADKENPPIIPQCEACKLAHMFSENKKRIEENRKKYEELIKNPEYIDVEFNEKTGGLKAVHIEHKFDKLKGHYEIEAQKVLYENGMAIILDSEKSFKPVAEGSLNGYSVEIKSNENNNPNTLRKRIAQSVEKEAEVSVIYFPNGCTLDLEKELHKYFGKMPKLVIVDVDKIIWNDLK